MTVSSLLLKINEVIVNPLIILMFLVATAVFVWGIAQFISSAETDDGRVKGKRNMLYGIIGFFIMISVYGILQLVIDTFDLETPDGGGEIGEFFNRGE